MKALTLGLLILFLYSCSKNKKSPSTYRNYIASWSPDGQELLFYSDRNGNWDIFRIKSDGTDLRQLTSSSFDEREPNWHPQRNAYAYSSDSLGERRIFLYDFDSNKTELITDFPGAHTSPAFSVGGRFLAYLIENAGQWKLMIDDLTDTTSFTAYEGNTYPGRPTWLADSTVLYSVAINGKETLHIAAIDGTVVRTYDPGYNSCGNAVVSGDGAYILFDAHSEDVLDSGDGKWEIYKISTDDFSVTRLTNNKNDDWGARWSPDGKRIAFMGGGLNNTGYELFVMNADGSGQIQLTHK